MPALAPASSRIAIAALGAAFACAPVLGLLDGGYPIAYWAPAAVVVALIAAVLLARLQRERLRGGVRMLGIGALAAFMVWTALAIGWSANQQVAWEELGRTGMYGAAVLLGVLAGYSRRAVHVGIATWLLGTAAIAALTLRDPGDAGDNLFLGGRLLGSVEYHNGEAAFLLVPIVAGTALAVLRSVEPLLRIALIGGIGLLLPLAVLPQSRGGLLSLAVALVIYLVISPARMRSALVLAAPLAATALAWGDLNAVYDAMGGDGARAGAELARAQQLILLSALGSTLAGAALVAIDHLVTFPKLVVRATKAAAGVVVVVAVVAALVAMPALRDPAGTLREQWDRATAPAASQPAQGQAASGRLGSLGGQSTAARVELWKVAWKDWQGHRIGGVGPANFEATFYEHRERALDRYARQPHNLVLELLAERGLVGLALFAVFLGAVFVQAGRVRWSDASLETRSLVAGLVGSVTYWFAHAQFDWLWQLSGVTLGVMLAMGCLLGAPWRLQASRVVPRTVRAPLIAVVAIVALLPLAPYLADRWAHDAERTLEQDPAGALRTLERAERVDPVSPTVARLRVLALEQLGRLDEADVALRESVERDPAHWYAHSFAAGYLERTGRDEAAADALGRARELNPLEPSLRGRGT